MEKIGKRTLVYSKKFIVPEGEQVDLTHNVEGWNLRVVIKFEQKAEQQGINIRPVDDYAQITFMKWDNGLGTCTAEPVRLGTHSSGKNIYFTAVNYCINGTNNLTFQILMGGDNE